VLWLDIITCFGRFIPIFCIIHRPYVFGLSVAEDTSKEKREKREKEEEIFNNKI